MSGGPGEPESSLPAKRLEQMGFLPSVGPARPFLGSTGRCSGLGSCYGRVCRISHKDPSCKCAGKVPTLGSSLDHRGTRIMLDSLDYTDVRDGSNFADKSEVAI